jgi:DNA-directed RNA polymerase specialized sigma24 family protein
METIAVDLTPRLRRYAHALLCSWPASPRSGEAGPRVDQDADDLVHEAMLGFWRAGFRRTGFAGDEGASRNDGALPITALPIALYRRVTLLARDHFTRKASAILNSETPVSGDGEPRHFAWAPEARALPQLDLDLRALLALVALERLTYAEAGAVLDLPAERVLARLAVARARLASAISGEARSHLRALPSPAAESGAIGPAGRPVTEGDLHRFVDEWLDARRSAEIGAALEAYPDIMRRACEWRRQSERLRRAFEPLLREPLPLSLNFAAPETSLWDRRRSLGPGDRILKRLASLLAAPASRAQPVPRPF